MSRGRIRALELAAGKVGITVGETLILVDASSTLGELAEAVERARTIRPPAKARPRELEVEEAPRRRRRRRARGGR